MFVAAFLYICGTQVQYCEEYLDYLLSHFVPFSIVSSLKTVKVSSYFLVMHIVVVAEITSNIVFNLISW